MASDASVVWEGGTCPLKEFRGATNTQQSRDWDTKFVAILRRQNSDEVVWFADNRSYTRAKETQFTIMQTEGQVPITLPIPEDVHSTSGGLDFFKFSKDNNSVVIRVEKNVDGLSSYLESISATHGIGGPAGQLPRRRTNATLPQREGAAEGPSTRIGAPPLPAVPLEYEDVPDEVVSRQFRLKAALSELQQIVPDSLATLELPPAFNSICLAGAQSVGKSTLLEYIVGCPCAFRRGGVGTRRPIIYHVLRNNSMREVQYRFGDQDKTINYTILVDELAERQGIEFRADAIEVYIEGPQLFTITVVDLPGYVSTNDLGKVKVINRVHISRPDALVVLVRRAVDWEGGDDREAKLAVADVDPEFRRTIVVTNQTRFLFNSLKEQMPGYLNASHGGTVFYPRAKKFFVDVMLEHGAHETSPVDIPDDPSEAAKCILQATSDLEDALKSVNVDLSPAGQHTPFVGVRRLSQYLRYAVIGNVAKADAWASAFEARLRGYVEVELRRVRRLAVGDKDQIATLHYSVHMFTTVMLDLLDRGGGALTAGMTSLDEHTETLRRLPSILEKRLHKQYSLDGGSWPLTDVDFPSKDTKLVGGPCYIRFQELEMQKIMSTRMDGKKGLFTSAKEVMKLGGLAKNASQQAMGEMLRKAVKGRLRALFAPATQYVLMRAVYCTVLEPMNEAIARMPKYDGSRGPHGIGPADLLTMGLLRPDSLWAKTVQSWLEDFITEHIFVEAEKLGMYIGSGQLTEFQGSIDDRIDKFKGQEDWEMLVANDMIKEKVSLFHSSINTLLDVVVKNKVLRHMAGFVTQRAVEFAVENPHELAAIFGDGNSTFLRRKDNLEKLNELLRYGGRR
eukprot:m.203491 g.203491  ORF g.203491 m.203491 type:complete len:849 (-) comp15372_c0_seq4:1151-3697(-)